MKKAILIASFGTTCESAIQSCILPLEQAAAAAYPDDTVHHCFTSDMVIHRLSGQGIFVDSPAQALARLLREGYQQIAVLPTMLTRGSEYEKLLTCINDFQSSFPRLTVAAPLLDQEEDLKAVASFIHNAYALQENEALLLMGHGTAGSENSIFRALAKILQNTDPRIFLAALEGPPALSPAIRKIVERGYPNVLVAPLMLTAGTHAVKHLSGASDTSWLSQCRAAGLETRCCLTSLGTYTEIQELYLRHLSASLAEN